MKKKLILIILILFVFSLVGIASGQEEDSGGCALDLGGCSSSIVAEDETAYEATKVKIQEWATAGYEFFYSIPPVPRPGKFLVGKISGSFESEYGTYEVDVYYPALEAGQEVPVDPSEAPYPVISFSHGAAANKGSNSWVGEYLASWGYVSGFFTTPHLMDLDMNQMAKEWTQGIIGTLDYIGGLNANSEVLGGQVAMDKAGVMGHSMGGYGTLFAISIDDRFKVAVPLAPAPIDTYLAPSDPDEISEFMAVDYSNIKIPVQMQVGEKDGFVAADLIYDMYHQLQYSPRQYVEIRGGNHVGYQSEGPEYDAATGVDFVPDISLDEQQRIAAKYFMAWFDYFLKPENEDKRQAAEVILFSSPNPDVPNVLSRFEFER